MLQWIHRQFIVNLNQDLRVSLAWLLVDPKEPSHGRLKGLFMNYTSRYFKNYGNVVLALLTSPKTISSQSISSQTFHPQPRDPLYYYVVIFILNFIFVRRDIFGSSEVTANTFF